MAERRRLSDSEARRADWKHWGPYVSDRAWGTVREDYSAEGDAWSYFPHDHARSRVYRWNEDGLAGFCNRFQNACMALALWNERDKMLKERLFGVTGPQGNHGEDAKEYWFHLDGTPTHSYMRMLYKYPQTAYPYEALVAEAMRRGRDEPEPELIDLLRDDLEQGRYFDVFIEYAKAGPEEILCRVTAWNRGPDPAPLHVLPQLWFRNTWSWGHCAGRPVADAAGEDCVHAVERHLGPRWWYARAADGGAPRLLFTENDTNGRRLFGVENESPYVKDAFHDLVVGGREEAVNPDLRGTKAAAWFRTIVPPGGSFQVRTRFAEQPIERPFSDFDAIFARRRAEADEFYETVQHPALNEEARRVQRQAFAGLMWTKQFYHYSVKLWLEGDPTQPTPPAERWRRRNTDWMHLYNYDVLSMPDKWEYPWYAAWDLAFHCLPIAMIDPEWAKRQILLLLREWYMHPNGQLPAYEWGYGNVNPPVHAWAAWRVYKIARNVTGKADVAFLERAFHKLLLNFTWWVNRKDRKGRNVFQGGFLGLDNIGVFDRSRPLPTGGYVEQADGTAWMAMFCLNMLAIALELALRRPVYEDVATKFFEHFIYIADAMHRMCPGELPLWDDEDGFFFDVIHADDGARIPLKLHSFVGLIPLLACETFEQETLNALPRFRRRVEWFLRYRPALVESIASVERPGVAGRHLLSIVSRDQLVRVLQRVLDPEQFLSDYGLRSLSREHRDRPYIFHAGGLEHRVQYEPAESSEPMFGGNSNWRGPIWMPVNYLMVESLQKYHHYYGEELRVDLPSGSERQATLDEVARDLAGRLSRIFLPDPERAGRRALHGGEDLFDRDPHWRDHVPFHEYFHGDSGAGLGASHQTGWTALIVRLLHRYPVG